MKAWPTVSISRRKAVHAIAAACALAGAAALPAAAQQAWPAHPVRLVVPFPASGATDLVARVVAQRMSQELGQQLVIDNRPGAGGTIGTGEAAKASPDGYTLLFTTSSTHAISPHLMPRLAYKADKDFTPIAEIGGAASILLVTPSLPVRNVQELIAYAKARPGALNYASSGNGTIVHLNAAAFAARAGLWIAFRLPRGQSGLRDDASAGDP
jgi:tripartite-type tricarboxylate transporter receptor subunit TctC